MEYRWISKVLHTKLNQPKTPGMNDTRKVSSQGKTDPKGLDRSVGRCKPPCVPTAQSREALVNLDSNTSSTSY